MVSNKIYDYCTSQESVSAALAKTPDKSPGDIATSLYDSHVIKIGDSPAPKERKPATAEDLDRARQCGRFGDTQPSELFLRAFHDVLATLDHDALNGVCSPSMLGSTGVNPFAVIGPLNDIARHMSNLIVRAKKEVLLATNYWMASGASRLITDALLELSRRQGERGGGKIPVKIMYDRGNIKQVMQNHQLVPESTYAAGSVLIPAEKDIPNLDLQVVNFHRPMLGTFHAKFMVVDREIALTQSNNIQDNDNVEMMVQLEGAIVDSIYDTFLCSWHIAIQPLPTINETATNKPPPTYQEESFKKLFSPDGKFRFPEDQEHDKSLPEHVGGDPHYDDDVAGECMRMHSLLSPQTPQETEPEIVARHLNEPTKLSVKPTAPAPSSASLRFFPFIPIPYHEPVPMAMVSRKPFGAPAHTSLHVPQNEAFLSLIRNAKDSIFIQTPDMNASPLPEPLLDAVRRGVVVTYYVCLGYNDVGELLPGQGGTNEMFAHSLLTSLEEDPGPDGVEKARDRLRVHYYVAKDQDHPICNKFKQRSCHVKLLIVDGHVAVQGSGNQDTQSWWQSQEINVMVDSPVVCRAWREGIERNQNTGVVPSSPQASDPQASQPGVDVRDKDGVPAEGHVGVSGPPPGRAYGQAAEDGCWRDANGELAQGSLGVDPGKFAWAKGIVGAVKRAQGKGGF